MLTKRFYYWIFFLLFFTIPVKSQPGLITRDIITNLDTPWEILWGQDGWIWFTERYGRISKVNPINGELKVLTKISEVEEISESGLLGMVLHPDFTNFPFVYVTYTWGSTKIYGRIARFSYLDDTLKNQIILMDSLPGSYNHNGSRLVIAPDTTLYITTGDGSDQNLSQNFNSLGGKVLRINLDGTIPSDNPIPNSPIWSWGHRNAQGLVLSKNGNWYSSEHGPSNDDEVNIIYKFRNYGWPNVHGFCDLVSETQFCIDSNIVEPIASYTPTLAVSGLDYYTHSAITGWENSLLMTSLKAAKLTHILLNVAGDSILNQKNYFVNQFGRLRDLCIAPDGRVFIATSNRDGRGVTPFPKSDDDRIIEITDTNSTSVLGKSFFQYSLSVLPNPGIGEFNIRINQPHPEMNYYVKSILGTIITNGKIFINENEKKITIEHPGFYYLQIENIPAYILINVR